MAITTIEHARQWPKTLNEARAATKRPDWVAIRLTRQKGTPACSKTWGCECVHQAMQSPHNM